MDYKSKYLKYKSKYIALKNKQIGGIVIGANNDNKIIKSEDSIKWPSDTFKKDLSDGIYYILNDFNIGQLDRFQDKLHFITSDSGTLPPEFRDVTKDDNIKKLIEWLNSEETVVTDEDIFKEIIKIVKEGEQLNIYGTESSDEFEKNLSEKLVDGEYYLINKDNIKDVNNKINKLLKLNTLNNPTTEIPEEYKDIADLVKQENVRKLIGILLGIN